MGAEKIEWCCKQTGEVQVISEELIRAGRILGLSEKNQCLCSLAVGKSEVLEERAVLSL